MFFLFSVLLHKKEYIPGELQNPSYEYSLQWSWTTNACFNVALFLKINLKKNYLQLKMILYLRWERKSEINNLLCIR
jgi:hypothetical protein